MARPTVLAAICWAILAISSPAAPPATEPAFDEGQAILRQLSPLMRELDAAAHANAISQPSIAQTAPQLIEKARKAIELARQLADVQPTAQEFAQHVTRRFTAELAALGDSQTLTKVEKDASSSDAQVAALAKAIQLHARWLKADADSPQRPKILEEAQGLAKADPSNDTLAFTLRDMQMGRLKTEQRQHIDSIIKEDLPNTKVAASIRDDEDGARRLAQLENQPLTISGVTLDGKQFSSEQWKGKVVLVDFWATWCGPCLAELPRVKKAYAEFHGKGLEVLGVSCDERGKDLAEFLQKNPDMPWPQLFDPSQPGWHALAREYGVRGIPTMFLIDKSGVVRSVKTREDFEQLIPRLLDE
jgi:thiol-disulfide isomerase/thioredoxin